MRLILEKKYKSLEPFEFELPDFTILTGINGAGKTQILTGIVNGEIILENGIYNGFIKYIPSNVLSPIDVATITSESINSAKQELWNQLQSFKNNTPNNPGALPEHYLGFPHLDNLKEIANITNKRIRDLDREELYKHYPMDDGKIQSDVFYHIFSNLFKRYKDIYTDNKFNKFLNEKEGHSKTSFLSETEFIEKWGDAPWDFLDKLNEVAGLNFAVNSPIEADKSLPFELALTDKTSGDSIKFNELSSGEKAIMSLALALYNSNFEKKFPKVLLMDEADGSLHPSMTKHFLRVIEDYFVKEKDLKVILSTHSPSTIALAEESSIFVVKKYGSPRIEKASKDFALKILTEGVPSFSVNYENRRQVFVESPNDVTYYEKIYQKISSHLNPEISLTFISSGDSRIDKNGTPVSNCAQVIHISEILRSAGNRFIWGIIDFDGKNKSSDHVKVIGDGNRYSMENYILDPLLLSTLLFREKLIDRSDIGLDEHENVTDMKNFTNDRLQTVANYVIKQVENVYKPKDNATSEAALVNGRMIIIPNWYLQYQGHQLEGLIIKVFPKLNLIKKNTETELKLAVINKVMDDVPSLISSDFLTAFNFVQDIS